MKGRDITDGHTAFYARFARPGLVLAAIDPSTPETKQHLKILEAANLEVATIQAPTKIRDKFRTKEFAAGYLGFYICNGAIIAQECADKKADHAAAEPLRKAFPGRQIVQLNTDGLAAGGGAIHGATLQEPS